MATGIAFATTVAIASRVHAQASPNWTEPFPPFRIAGNLYYVGSKGLANYLITTPQGHILINSDLEANVVHGSDAPETASFEIPYFFATLELCPR